MFEIGLEKSHVIVKFSLKTRSNLSLVSFMRMREHEIKHPRLMLYCVIQIMTQVLIKHWSVW